jgi:hypothetical protein
MSTPTQAAGAGSLTEEDHSLRQTQGKEWAKSGAQVSSVGGDYAGPRVKETARRRNGETATGGDGEGDGGEENRVQGSGFRVQGSGFRVQVHFLILTSYFPRVGKNRKWKIENRK